MREMHRSVASGFRIILDFVSFFQDKRKRCYYYIDLSRNETLRDVHNEIQTRFGIGEAISLELNGCFLPEDENVRVLYDGDVVRVVAARSTFQTKRTPSKYVADSKKSLKGTNAKNNTESGDNVQEDVSKPKEKRKSTTIEHEEQHEMGDNDINGIAVDEIIAVRKRRKRKLNSTERKKRQENRHYEGDMRAKKKRGLEYIEAIEELESRDEDKVNTLGVEEQDKISDQRQSISLGVYELNVQKSEMIVNYISDEVLCYTNNVNKNNESEKKKKRSSSMNEYVDWSEYNDHSKNEVYNKLNDNSQNNLSESCEGEGFTKTKKSELPYVQTQVLDPELFVAKTSNPVSVDHTEEEQNNLKSYKYSQNGDNASELSGNREGKSKRKRRRRHKKIMKEVDFTSDHNYFAQSVNVSPVLKNTSQTPKHIKFPDDDDDDDSESGGNSELRADQTSDVIDNVKIPVTRIQNYQSRNLESNLPSQLSVPLQRTPCNRTDVPEILSDNIFPKSCSTPLIFECRKANRSCNESATVAEKDINFSQYPVLKALPKVNEIIAFKKWKMDTNYCPGISEYISAKVLQVKEADGTVYLKILRGHDEFKEPEGKFSLTSNEENSEENVDKENTEIEELHMNIKDLLEMRLIFP